MVVRLHGQTLPWLQVAQLSGHARTDDLGCLTKMIADGQRREPTAGATDGTSLMKGEDRVTLAAGAEVHAVSSC